MTEEQNPASGCAGMRIDHPHGIIIEDGEIVAGEAVQDAP